MLVIATLTELIHSHRPPQLVRYESVDSHHGIGPHTVRIPTFIDHIITALMQADVTIQGILRKSTNLHQLGNIIAALDNADGNDTVIDLAALDPITLANLFKKFLSALPDPVLSGHLFKLFIATSRESGLSRLRELES